MDKWQHRKSACQIVLKDAQGNPMPGRKVHVELKQHEFLFGTGVFWTMDLLDPATPLVVGEREEMYADTSNLERELAYSPVWDYEEALPLFADWFLENYNKTFKM